MRQVFLRMAVHRLFMRSFVVAGLLCATTSAPAQRGPSRLECSPVIPGAEVPFIEVAKRPDVAHDRPYLEWCTDLDNVWPPQNYPDPRYVPKRASEHLARVNLLLQGLKDVVAAEPDDWVSYVNAWLGSNLPPPGVERRRFLDREATSSVSYSRGNVLTKIKSTSDILSTNSWQHVSPQGAMIYRNHDLSISGLDTAKLCVTYVDLQKAFENQPGYLLHPMSVQESETGSNPEKLARLGRPWFGYDVYAFADPVTKQGPGLMSFGFDFKPCASNISFSISKRNTQKDKQ